MKTALVISGGGCKGAFAVGAIEWLLEKGLSFDILIGTSTGALITPLVGGDRFEVAKEIYSNIKTKQLIRKYCWLTLPWRSAIYNDKGLRKVIDKNYTDELHKKLCASDREILVCTVSLNTGETCYWSPNDLDRDGFARALSASSNQPGLMPPRRIKIGEDYHVDGGVREIAPIQKAIECGAKKVFAIVLEPSNVSESTGEFNRILPILLRSLELVFVETRKNDIEIAEHHGTELIIIRPKVHLTKNSLEFIPEEMRAMMKDGYQQARTIYP